MAHAPTATEKTLLAECDCSAGHVHATRSMYGYHKCRCEPCCEANRAYYQATAHLTNKRRWVDPAPVRDRIVFLRKAGLTIAQMADLCAVQTSVLNYVLHGRSGRFPSKVLATTFEALQAIRARDITAVEATPDTRIDGTVPALQTMALQAAGWTVEDLAERSEVSVKTFYRLLRGLRTTEEMRARVDVLYRQMAGTSPEPVTPLQETRRRRALARAAEHGWTTGMAEDAAYGQAA